MARERVEKFVPPIEKDEKWGPLVKDLMGTAGTPVPDWAILRLLDSGLLKIYNPGFSGIEGYPEGFNPEHLGTDSVDLTLGEHIFKKWKFTGPRRIEKHAPFGDEERQQILLETIEREDLIGGTLPLYDLEDIEGISAYGYYHFLTDGEDADSYWWGPYKGVKKEEILKNSGVADEIKQKILDNEIPDGARLVVADTDDELLCHTTEFVGAENYLAGALSTKSGLARQGFATHTDSWAVKTGFRGRLTLELRNWDPPIFPMPQKESGKPFPRRYKVLWTGMPLLSIQFTLNSGFTGENNSQFGNFKKSWDEIINEWNPYLMIPGCKTYRDHEEFKRVVKEFKSKGYSL